MKLAVIDSAWTNEHARRVWYSTLPMASESAPPHSVGGGTLPAAYASDRAFVEGLRRQESPAFEELCRRHLPRVRTILYRVLGSDNEIPDVTQEVVIRALGAAPKFRGEATQLEGWITKIAIFTARDVIRKRQLFRRFFSSKEVDEDAFPAQLATVEQRETVRRTYRALRQLSADDRIAFSLRVIDGMKMEQVAEACDVSLSTAKRRVEKARRRFEALADRDPALRELLRGGDA